MMNKHSTMTLIALASFAGSVFAAPAMNGASNPGMSHVASAMSAIPNFAGGTTAGAIGSAMSSNAANAMGAAGTLALTSLNTLPGLDSSPNLHAHVPTVGKSAASSTGTENTQNAVSGLDTANSHSQALAHVSTQAQTALNNVASRLAGNPHTATALDKIQGNPVMPVAPAPVSTDTTSTDTDDTPATTQ